MQSSMWKSVAALKTVIIKKIDLVYLFLLFIEEDVSHPRVTG